MLDSLTDIAFGCLLDHLNASSWARMTCVNRGVKQRVLVNISSKPHCLHVDWSTRQRHKSKQKLRFAGDCCPSVTQLSLLSGSGHQFDSLQLLQPCITHHLTHLTLQGLHLVTFESCTSFSQVVRLLVQNCPRLQVLDLQGCILAYLSEMHDLLHWPERQQLQQKQLPHLAEGQEQQQQEQQRQGHQLKVKVLQLTGATFILPQQQRRGQRGSDDTSGGTASQSDFAGTHTLKELHLGSGSDPGLLWLRMADAVGDTEVLSLLQVAGCKALQVLDVSRRCCVTDTLMQQLAPQAPLLRVLDISLTAVTPDGLLVLVSHCKQLAVLRYACREGSGSLEASHVQQLAAAATQLEELDASLHSQLDDDCMTALRGCQQLRQVTLSRSHKVTAAGLEQLLQAGRLQQVTLVRCKGINQRRLKQVAAAHPTITICTGSG